MFLIPKKNLSLLCRLSLFNKKTFKSSFFSSSSSSNGPNSNHTNTKGGSSQFWKTGLFTLGLGGAAAFWWYSEQQKSKKNDPAVFFVLGGPGAGKGTQCANLVRDFGFVHLSAGDLLRTEQNTPGSPYGDLIKSYIREGKIVPMEITISLLEKAMKESGVDRFLIDGFPRAMDQALGFEKQVCPGNMVLYFECPEEEMLKRLLRRGETSGRIDDNIDSIKKRFKTFRDTSYPVIEHYDKLNKVKKVSCLNSVDGVYQETYEIFNEYFNKKKN